MKINTLLLIAGVLSLVACSTPTTVDTGAIRAQSFSFVNPGPRPAPNYSDNRAQVHAMIQEAITKNLAGRGISRTESGGDIVVGYMVVVGNNVATQGIDDYFGYGEDAAALHQKAHNAYTGSKNPNYFEAGTLLIDVVDAKTHKLLRRGHATRPSLRNLAPDAKAEQIQGAVDAVLQDLRIER